MVQPVAEFGEPVLEIGSLSEHLTHELAVELRQSEVLRLQHVLRHLVLQHSLRTLLQNVQGRSLERQQVDLRALGPEVLRALGPEVLRAQEPQVLRGQLEEASADGPLETLGWSQWTWEPLVPHGVEVEVVGVEQQQMQEDREFVFEQQEE